MIGIRLWSSGRVSIHSGEDNIGIQLKGILVTLQLKVTKEVTGESTDAEDVR